ncbi:hypothetical protein A9Q99_26825 [Gammaproteobacteria bacterium 45_16_T64]|nr:hypothetical protein A9Q99_26825 [Gammaproteobacteria bacterium 45_16_T64]
MEQPTYSIGIVGAGIAGLSAGLALIQAGHQVTIFEKSSDIGEVGAGIQLSANATRILSSWGLLPAIRGVGFEPQGIKMQHWESGETIAIFAQNSQVSTEVDPYIHIHRADLHGTLYQAVQSLDGTSVQIDHEVLGVSQKKQCATIAFKGREPQDFDWVVGADGIHSIVRPSALSINEAPNFTGNVAWRGLIDVELLDSKPKPFTHVVMGPGAHVVFYYVKGGRKLNYVAVTERDNWDRESWTEKGSVDELLNDFLGWDPALLSILKKTSDEDCFRWALYDRNPLDTLSNGRCLVIGDAAHPMLPFLAQGAAMGIEDAQALAWCLQRFPPERVGEQMLFLRGKRSARVQLAARKNMSIFHERSRGIRWARDSILRTVSLMYPNFMNKKLQWLYEYKLK